MRQNKSSRRLIWYGTPFGAEHNLGSNPSGKTNKFVDVGL